MRNGKASFLKVATQISNDLMTAGPDDIGSPGVHCQIADIRINLLMLLSLVLILSLTPPGF